MTSSKSIIYRSRAPLRLGLAGGGTDLPDYSEKHGGAVLNATVSMYAYASIEPRDDGKVVFKSIDLNTEEEFPEADAVADGGKLDLLKSVFFHVQKNHASAPLSFTLTTYVDVPPGSGMGSSSTLVVAILGAFVEWLNLPFGEYDLASIAYHIERNELKLSGGKQDQYAAAFGGFNFMEFLPDDKVIVNPLRVRADIVRELEFCFLLYFSSISRESAKIIDSQVKSVSMGGDALEALHRVKTCAFALKESLLTGRLTEIGKILNQSWIDKKATATAITNPILDHTYELAIAAGAAGGKVSGAGGGGFMTFYCPGTARYSVIDSLMAEGGEFRRFNFIDEGLVTWQSQGRFR